MAKTGPKNAGKAPSVQFYFKDYYADMLEHPDWVNGLWILVLCKIWHEKNRGQITRTIAQLSKMLGVDDIKVTHFLEYIEQENIADVTRGNNRVTIVNRRSRRDHKVTEQNRLRQEKFRNKKNNAKVTAGKRNPSSSTSTSVTTIKDYSSMQQKQVTPENDPDLHPEIYRNTPPSPNDLNPIVQENRRLFIRVCILWNAFAKKKANKDDINTESAVLIACNSPDRCGKEQFIKAIENYALAVQHPNSQAWPFNLHKFAISGYQKFLPGVFDIDNYDKTKFQKAPDADDKVQKAMDYK